jgi:hypothetical protein
VFIINIIDYTNEAYLEEASFASVYSFRISYLDSEFYEWYWSKEMTFLNRTELSL